MLQLQGHTNMSRSGRASGRQPGLKQLFHHICDFPMKSDSVSKEKEKQPYRQKKVKHLQKTTARLWWARISAGVQRGTRNVIHQLLAEAVGTECERDTHGQGRQVPPEQDLIFKRKTDIYISMLLRF